MSDQDTAQPLNISHVLERQGLRGLAAAMDEHGDIPFHLLLQGTRTMPKGKEAVRFVREALILGGKQPVIKATLARPEQRERLNVRLDPTPLRTFGEDSWDAIEVSGKLNVAALLGLPAEEPVAEVRQLLATWDRWAAYRGPAPTTPDAWGQQPFLQIYKASDHLNKRGFAWCGPTVAEGSDERFAADLAADPFLAQWMAGVQRGLALQRLGPHSWVTLTGAHLDGDEAHIQLMRRQYAREAADEAQSAGPPAATAPRRPRVR